MISVAYLEKDKCIKCLSCTSVPLEMIHQITYCNVHSHYTHFDCLLLLQVVSMWTLRAGAARTSTCTGSTSTVTCWWCAPRHVASSTCGMRSAALTNCLRTSTRCACSPKPWTRPHTVSWACCSSDTRSRRTSTNRSSGAELKNLDGCYLVCICSQKWNILSLFTKPRDIWLCLFRGSRALVGFSLFLWWILTEALKKHHKIIKKWSTWSPVLR